MELLTVIAITGILVALLSTALNQAKGRAHKISCLGNLRQLQTAWILYADDNEDYLPLNRSEPSVNEAVFGRSNTDESWVAGNPKLDITTANIERGSLFPYVKSSLLYRCPADPGKVWVDKSVRRTRSYTMSAYLSGDQAIEDPRVKLKLADVQNQPASKIFVFIEEDMAGPWLGAFHVIPYEKTALASAGFSSLPGTWHAGGTDISFADGHVEYWSWQTAKNAPLQQDTHVLLRHGAQGLRRLQAAIPRP